jgi:hypothetical protein
MTSAAERTDHERVPLRCCHLVPRPRISAQGSPDQARALLGPASLRRPGRASATKRTTLKRNGVDRVETRGVCQGRVKPCSSGMCQGTNPTKESRNARPTKVDNIIAGCDDARAFSVQFDLSR